jgi:hypothetical protein
VLATPAAVTIIPAVDAVVIFNKSVFGIIPTPHWQPFISIRNNRAGVQDQGRPVTLCATWKVIVIIIVIILR